MDGPSDCVSRPTSACAAWWTGRGGVGGGADHAGAEHRPRSRRALAEVAGAADVRLQRRRRPAGPHDRPRADRGYRVWVRGLGRCRISPGGDTIECAPPRAKAGRWRLLIGQGLPIAAALRGLEVLHSSAVVSRPAVAFVAPSGTGKTSLALEFVIGGARLLADDVVVLEATDTGCGPTLGRGS